MIKKCSMENNKKAYFLFLVLGICLIVFLSCNSENEIKTETHTDTPCDEKIVQGAFEEVF